MIRDQLWTGDAIAAALLHTFRLARRELPAGAVSLIFSLASVPKEQLAGHFRPVSIDSSKVSSTSVSRKFSSNGK